MFWALESVGICFFVVYGSNFCFFTWLLCCWWSSPDFVEANIIQNIENGTAYTDICIVYEYEFLVSVFKENVLHMHPHIPTRCVSVDLLVWITLNTERNGKKKRENSLNGTFVQRLRNIMNSLKTYWCIEICAAHHFHFFFSWCSVVIVSLPCHRDLMPFLRDSFFILI